MLPPTKAGNAWARWALMLACAPAVALVALGLWFAYADVQMKRMLALRGELERLRFEEARRAGRLEAALEYQGPSSGENWISSAASPEVADVFRNEQQQPHRLYAAVVNEAGTIVWHTDPQRIGLRLAHDWYERRVPDAGPDVTWHSGGALSGDTPAYDVRLPLRPGGVRSGDYHFGVDSRWAEEVSAASARSAMIRWCLILGPAALLGAGAVAGLHYLCRRHQLGELRLERQSRARARELSQLGGGLAHEVRNPLHALRINMHTLRRAMAGRGTLSEEQLVATIQESDAAIDRLDALMRDLLQFTDPTSGAAVRVDVGREVQATLSLLADTLRCEEINFQTAFPPQPAEVAIDPVRLRQMLHNVLTFAQHRSGKGGTIAVEVHRTAGFAEVAVTDSGPPLAADQLNHVFEPFQAPVETGSGLGLALVQTYAAATGGRVALEQLGPRGHRLRISLPLAVATESGVN